MMVRYPRIKYLPSPYSIHFSITIYLAHRRVRGQKRYFGICRTFWRYSSLKVLVVSVQIISKQLIDWFYLSGKYLLVLFLLLWDLKRVDVLGNIYIIKSTYANKKDFHLGYNLLCYNNTKILQFCCHPYNQLINPSSYQQNIYNSTLWGMNWAQAARLFFLSVICLHIETKKKISDLEVHSCV